MGNFRTLVAWQKANELVVRIHRGFRTRGATGATGLRGQLLRSAGSTADNLAEGCAQKTQAEFVRYCDDAYTSAKEAENQIERANMLGAFSPEADAEITAVCDEVCRLCYKLSGRKGKQ